MAVRSIPREHQRDPLELGVIARGQEGLRTVGLASEGALRGAAVFQGGTCVVAGLPGLSAGSSLGVEVTVFAQPSRARSVRFTVDGTYVSPPLDLSDTQGPIAPVLTLSAETVVEVVPFFPSAALGPSSSSSAAPATAPSLQRVRIWDTLKRKLITGNATPLLSNLKKYLAKYPHREVYTGQDGTQHRRRGAAEHIVPSEEETPRGATEMLYTRYAELSRRSGQPHSSSDIFNVVKCLVESVAWSVETSSTSARARNVSLESTSSELPQCHGSSEDDDSLLFDLPKRRTKRSREPFTIGAPVLVSGRGGGVVVKILANSWRRVRLDSDASESNYKQRELLELDDGFGPPSFGNGAFESGGDAASDEDGEADEGRSAEVPRRSSRRAARRLSTERGDETSSDEDSLEGQSQGGARGRGSDRAKRWICCDRCNKWRSVPEPEELPPEDEEWSCDKNTWDNFNRCWVAEENGAHEQLPAAESDTDGSVDDGAAALAALMEMNASGGLRSRDFGGGKLWRGHNESLVAAEELAVVTGELADAAEAVWALPKGRLVVWVENRAYAVAHAGETLKELADAFAVELDDVLILNAALVPSIGAESILTPGSTLLLPWLEDERQRFWHELTAHLVASGWRVDWATGPGDRRCLAYFPPSASGDLSRSRREVDAAPSSHVEASVDYEPSFRVRPFMGLPEIMRAIPELLEVFEYAAPSTAVKYLARLAELRGRRLSLEVLHPKFDVGDWAMSQWPGDNLWYLAKVMSLFVSLLSLAFNNSPSFKIQNCDSHRVCRFFAETEMGRTTSSTKTVRRSDAHAPSRCGAFPPWR